MSNKIEDSKIINIIIDCPHCNCPMEIIQLNCRIFRHGIFKSNNTQINPHASKEECDYYINIFHYEKLDKEKLIKMFC